MNTNTQIIFGIMANKKDKVIYFKNNNYETDYCSGKTYCDFIDYAFSKADYFMLVYINYYGKGYTKKQTYFRDALKPFKVKSRSNPSWPGTLETYSKNTTYKIVFYRTDNDAKKILYEVSKMSDWSGTNPEDLAFFKRNQCWFYSVGHENIAGIIHCDDEDIAFLESHNLASKSDAFIPIDNYFDAFDEK